MERDLIREKRYLEVVQRVKNIRAFYLHLILFIVINTSVIVWAFMNADAYDQRVLLWAVSSFVISWIVGIVIHAIVAFGNRILFSKSWEDKKMQEYLDEGNDKIWE